MRFRVLTYNIHKCIGGLDRRYDPYRIGNTIAHYDPDFVLMQEVAQKTRSSHYVSQVNKLAEILGMRHRRTSST